MNPMKTFYVIAIGLFFSLGTAAQEIKFETEYIDYGKIAQNSNGERTFVFTNTGDKPLIIRNVQSSCGCTIPEKPSKPIMPGEKGEIKVKYDTKRIGGFYKQITVFSNAVTASRKVVKIRGYVNKPEQISLEKKKSIVTN